MLDPTESDSTPTHGETRTPNRRSARIRGAAARSNPTTQNTRTTQLDIVAQSSPSQVETAQANASSASQQNERSTEQCAEIYETFCVWGDDGLAMADHAVE